MAGSLPLGWILLEIGIIILVFNKCSVSVYCKTCIRVTELKSFKNNIEKTWSSWKYLMIRANKFSSRLWHNSNTISMSTMTSCNYIMTIILQINQERMLSYRLTCDLLTYKYYISISYSNHNNINEGLAVMSKSFWLNNCGQASGLIALVDWLY